ncbi:MAG: hypothetical protein KJO69_07445 [Gammaproteobacteria bacterium]|nr:hypothetical protein [Gammaproteobacteria bacterium]
MKQIKHDYSTWRKSLDNAFRFKPGEKDEIIKQVKDALFNGDELAIGQIMSEYHELDQKMKVWALFTSWERDSIKKLLEDKR